MYFYYSFKIQTLHDSNSNIIQVFKIGKECLKKTTVYICRRKQPFTYYRDISSPYLTTISISYLGIAFF